MVTFVIPTKKPQPSLPSCDPHKRESVPPIPPAPRERERDNGNDNKEGADKRRDKFNHLEGERV